MKIYENIWNQLYDWLYDRQLTIHQTWFLDFIFWLPLQYPPIDGWIPHDITNMEELGFKEDAPQAEVEVTAKILRVL